jgi:hypothetical protein
MIACAMTAGLAACGSSGSQPNTSSSAAQIAATSSAAETTSSAAQTVAGFTQVQARCARTFREIVAGVEANPANSPAWVQDFIDPTLGVIGEQADLVGGAPGPSSGSILCGLDFNENAHARPGAWIAAFATGYTTFDGSAQAPYAQPENGVIPQYNVRVGSDGSLTPSQ